MISTILMMVTQPAWFDQAFGHVQQGYGSGAAQPADNERVSLLYLNTAGNLLKQ